MKHKIISPVLFAMALSVISAAGQSAGEWNQFKQQNGLPPGLTYDQYQQMLKNGYTGRVNVPTVNPMQNLRVQAAGQLGNALGQALGDALSGPSQAELDAQRQQQEAAAAAARYAAEQERLRLEAERVARINTAASLRATWDGRDKVISQELGGVFDLPVAHGAPAGGNANNAAQDDTSTVDLRNPSTGTDFFGSGNSSVTLVDSGDTSVVDLRGTAAGDGNGFAPILASPSAVSLGGAGLAPGSPILAPPVNPTPKVYTRAELQTEIRNVQSALKNLNKSMKLDASQRTEWEDMSNKATKDTWELTGKVAAQGMLYELKWFKQKQAEEKVVQLSGEELPLLRYGLHNEYRVIAEDKKALEYLEKGDKVTDLAIHSGEAATTGGAERNEKLKEAAFDLLDLTGKLPGAGEFKNMAEANQLAWTQHFSSERIETLNANSEQYLTAVRVLNARMTGLVQMEKNLPQ